MLQRFFLTQRKFCGISSLSVSSNLVHYKKNEKKDEKHVRKFHYTAKKEIVPFVLLGATFIGYYSYRALKRMDLEWEEYQEALLEYKLENEPLQGEPPQSPRSKEGNKRKFSGEKIAIDLGSLNIRIAHMSPHLNGGRPNVVVNREGARATPNQILYNVDGSFVVGQLAAGKLYENACSSLPVINVGKMLREHETKLTPIENQMIENIIFSSAKDVLDQVRGVSKPSKPLFSFDEKLNGYNIQPIFTYEPKGSPKHSKGDSHISEYQGALKNLYDPHNIAKFVPEPVSAVLGAKYYNMLPSTPGPTMVIDVGAFLTCCSIIDREKNTIISHSRVVGFGGETLVETLMNYLTEDFYGEKLSEISDTMAKQRLYQAAQSAVLELSSGNKQNLGRIQINIPYLSVDSQMNPRHLNMGLNAKVLETEFNDVAKNIGSDLQERRNVLSRSIHVSDLSSLFSSIVMASMELTSQNPFGLNSILIVGGGARSPIIQQSLKKGIGALGGDQYVEERMIVPKDELIEELVVLGATQEFEVSSQG